MRAARACSVCHTVFSGRKRRRIRYSYTKRALNPVPLAGLEHFVRRFSLNGRCKTLRCNALDFGRKLQGNLDREAATVGCPTHAGSVWTVDFWNTIDELDSLFQKSLLLSHLLSRNPGKSRRNRARDVPKRSEFTPHGPSSKINQLQNRPVPQIAVPQIGSAIQAIGGGTAIAGRQAGGSWLLLVADTSRCQRANDGARAPTKIHTYII